MAKFTDNKNREWTLYVDVPLAREVRRQTDGDILNLEEGLSKIAADPILLVDVLWVLVADQANEQGVSDVDFGKALFGQAIAEAREALMEALLDFSPPRQRKVLQSIWTAGKEFQEMLAGMDETKLPFALAMLAQSISGDLSPDSAESPDTTPAAV